MERRTRAGQVPERDGEDLGVADDDVLVAVGIRRDAGPKSSGQGGPRRFGLDDVTVRVDDRAGARRERQVVGAAAVHVAAVRQSSTGGSP
jgi:hypothetical protein